MASPITSAAASPSLMDLAPADEAVERGGGGGGDALVQGYGVAAPGSSPDLIHLGGGFGDFGFGDSSAESGGADANWLTFSDGGACPT
jgi:hypothetical protein